MTVWVVIGETSGDQAHWWIEGVGKTRLAAECIAATGASATEWNQPSHVCRIMLDGRAVGAAWQVEWDVRFSLHEHEVEGRA